ncbi:MAG: amidase, partial [Gemmatirosa sp.]|nr:amidase [Gemmatirosa sp.]
MATSFDPSFGTATQALAAMRDGAISSRELTAHVFDRIGRYDPALHAFVTLREDAALAEAARADAARADAARARGEPLGALHGLPVLVKDVFATAATRTTAGSASLAGYVPTEDAAAVARLVGAGAIVVGKTNVPEFAGDWQAFNDVAGTTSNPWDATRTSGGSTGGGAAALAAGLGFLELGGDLAGSLRIPAHCCGVYGHRPSAGLVPTRGHIPPPPGVPDVPNELSAAGPLARDANDLRLALAVLGGPDTPDALAYRWTMPAPRRARLADYRVGYVLDDPFCPVDASVQTALASAVDALRRSGVRLTEGWPDGVAPSRQY